MTRTTRRGTTVELAISSALTALGVTRDEVEVEVINQGRKGFLGFGAKEAEVTVTIVNFEEPSVTEKISMLEEAEPVMELQSFEIEGSVESVESPVEKEEVQVEGLSDETAIEETEHYLKMIAIGMGIDDIQISHEIKGKYVTFQMESAKAALLIGKRGQTLNALQQLSQLVTNKSASQFKVVRVDVGDYRERREQSLEQLAERMADKAVRTGKKIQLEPMASYERKVIHNALSRRLDIETYSEGSDPFRYLVIEAVR
ncbi:RNA-binding cell elongation regulator Jag/EloR [Sporosarcina sp. E16_8]|uniref:RNA-binding cell elongation regulator Jag/EloR n=1 Tax=Sporosarcina sp. E16_8 TaxID=2789295 RepID=UPI001A91F246|nr:RNA-binding cell elongation regulator Jag/EloR [Sporosarcina sp. E16_8]MBO0587562.1 protein jag [Sporosarcina sp. E16_8]